jgi:hypothetical protein
MTYTISLAPSAHGKLTATSAMVIPSLPPSHCSQVPRYWLDHGADPAATITTIWSSGPGHWALRLNRRPRSQPHRDGRPLQKAQMKADASLAHAAVSRQPMPDSPRHSSTSHNCQVYDAWRPGLAVS